LSINTNLNLEVVKVIQSSVIRNKTNHLYSSTILKNTINERQSYRIIWVMDKFFNENNIIKNLGKKDGYQRRSIITSRGISSYTQIFFKIFNYIPVEINRILFYCFSCSSGFYYS